LLSSLPAARTSYVVLHPSANPGPTNSGYTPAQIQQAYGFNQVSNNGAGETIAIVDAYNDPNISSDLATFDGAYGLAAPPSFTVVNQSGGSTLPSNDVSWGGEESLDVEWAHAMAPGAKILLGAPTSRSRRTRTAS
jgi:subtilase family serine protease